MHLEDYSPIIYSAFKMLERTRIASGPESFYLKKNAILICSRDKFFTFSKNIDIQYETKFLWATPKSFIDPAS